jgi:o-succinylbenzoate synthase
MSRPLFPPGLEGPVEVFSLRLALQDMFRIAHGSYSHRENVFLLLRRGGRTGLGEAPIVPYYGDRAAAVAAQLRRALGGGRGRERIAAWLSDAPPPLPPALCPTARCALETALLDLRAQAAGMRLGAWLGAGAARPPVSSYTLACRDAGEALSAARSAPLPFFKLKMGFRGDIQILQAVRRAFPAAPVRIDVNQGWKLPEALEKVKLLEELEVELIEEPLDGSLEDTEKLAAATSIPVLLDESVRSLADLEVVLRRAPSVAGIVAKPAKTGGPAACRDLIRRARSAGLDAMISSQVVTSLGATAAAHLAPLCRWCDLDAPLLLAADPWRGLRYRGGRIRLPRGPGLGVRPGPQLAALLAGAAPDLL